MTAILNPRQRGMLKALYAYRCRQKVQERQQAHAMRLRRKRRVQQLSDWMAAGAALKRPKRERRTIHRTDGGWRASTLNQYVEKGDDLTYSKKFRVERVNFDRMVAKLSAAGYVTDNKCRNKKHRMTAAFKVGVALYFFAHGCCEYDTVGDVSSLGERTVSQYLDQFCQGALAVLQPIYMPSTPPSAENLARVRAEFAKRRGIANVAQAVDGTHVPFRGGPDYRNYKGWTSILVLAWVNSFHLFVEGDVGAAGRAGDNGVLAGSWFMQQVRADPEAWLGKDGVIAADGGASDGGDLLLNPIADAREVEELWYKFCHSSTRFFVEETFGRWKNRFRFLLRQIDLDHKTATILIYVSMILHNFCTIHTVSKDNAVSHDEGTDEEWAEFFKKFARQACPSCVRRGAMHCPHAARNAKAKAVPKGSGGSAALREAIKNALWNDLIDSNDDDWMGAMRARANGVCRPCV